VHLGNPHQAAPVRRRSRNASSAAFSISTA
jgi:hypothetical protein